MFKRTILATVAAAALAVGAYAQESATLLLRSGEKVTGQLVDMGGTGFTVRVDGKERQVATNEVAVIDFAGGGDIAGLDWSKFASGQGVMLKSGQTVAGQLYDIGGTSPLRITLKTDSGNRDFTSNEVGQIVLAKPTGAVATTGSASTAGVPEGEGIAVPATQAWTATPLRVRKGDVLSFDASGEVRLNTAGTEVAGTAGARSQLLDPRAPLPKNYAGALIGRVGTNGEPFPIGDQQTVTMPADGILFLGINDSNLSDNQGGFRVNVKRPSRR